jgi:putative NADPH-quinone reductase
MARKILVLLGHPRSSSLCGALAEAYEKGAESARAEVRSIRLGDMSFDPVTLAYGSMSVLEPDLAHLQSSMLWAHHIAMIYPNWWGGAPGQFKSALERVLLPGVAFKYHDNGHGWDRLLQGRTGELIVTMDTPTHIYRWAFGAAGDKLLSQRTLDFCGVKVRRSTHLGPVRSSTPEKRNRWLAKARRLGARAAQ